MQDDHSRCYTCGDRRRTGPIELVRLPRACLRYQRLATASFLIMLAIQVMLVLRGRRALDLLIPIRRGWMDAQVGAEQQGLRPHGCPMHCEVNLMSSFVVRPFAEEAALKAGMNRNFPIPQVDHGGNTTSHLDEIADGDRDVDNQLGGKPRNGGTPHMLDLYMAVNGQMRGECEAAKS